MSAPSDVLTVLHSVSQKHAAKLAARANSLGRAHQRLDLRSFETGFSVFGVISGKERPKIPCFFTRRSRLPDQIP